MTPGWTVFPFPIECGAAGGHQVPAHAPVRVISRAIYRCSEHAVVDVDWAAVDRARHAIEVSRQPVPARAPRPPVRVTPVRKPVPLSAIADALPFDPKAAASGDRE